MLFKIQSLKQLLVVSFSLVLIPLAALLWHSNSTLSSMAKAAASEPIHAVGVTRNLHQLDRLALDIERATRQYQIVRKIEVQDLVLNYIERYQVNLEVLCKSTSLTKLCNENEVLLISLTQVYSGSESELTQALSKLRLSLNRLKDMTHSQLDQRLMNQQAHIEKVKAKQVGFTIALISLSLLLALYSSRKILQPVQKIESLIGQLTDKKHHLSSISHSGPAELIKLERQLHQLAKRLNQLETLRQTMLRHAAHELKTPLASIKEGCSLLSDEVLGGLNSRQEEVVTLLNTSSLRLESLVGQLLDYTMLLQQTEPNLDAINLPIFLEHFLTDNKLALQQNGHNVEVKMAIDVVQADEVLLRRIFDNILSNAIAYGDTSGAIVINIYQENTDQIIEIANAGPVIPIQDRELLFKPFQRGQENRHDRVSGSGLGLSIVSECAALMLGNVCFVDSDFADICVRIKIPVT